MNAIDGDNRELTLLEALEHFAKPDDLAAYLPHKPHYKPLICFLLGARQTQQEAQEEQARKSREPLETSLLEKLRRGDVVAYADVEPLEADTDPIKISAKK